MGEGVLDETDITVGGGGVQTKMWDCYNGKMRTDECEKTGMYIHSVVTLYFDSALCVVREGMMVVVAVRVGLRGRLRLVTCNRNRLLPLEDSYGRV
jgi:hypothetical protein